MATSKFGPNPSSKFTPSDLPPYLFARFEFGNVEIWEAAISDTGRTYRNMTEVVDRIFRLNNVINRLVDAMRKH